MNVCDRIIIIGESATKEYTSEKQIDLENFIKLRGQLPSRVGMGMVMAAV